MRKIYSKSFKARRHGGRKEVVEARLLFARQLLVRYGVPYSCVWSLTGFSSVKEMEHYWERMFRS